MLKEKLHSKTIRMKNLIFIMILFASTQVFAQEEIKVQQKEWAVGDKMQPAFVVEVPQTNAKDAINLWEKTLVPKNIFDTFKKLPKMEKEEKNEWVIQKVLIGEICPDSLDVYTRITETKDRITFAALFDNYGSFIGNNSNEAKNAKEYVRNYAVELYRQGVNNELDDLKKALKKKEKDLTGSEKDNRKLDRKSEESQSNLSFQRESSTATSSLEESEERLKEMKKEEKAIKKYAKKIDKNSGKQKKLNKEINKIEDEIKDVERKLKNIK